MDWSILEYAFMQKALLAGLLGGVSCAVTGVLVVTLRITAIGTCMAHAAFAGALVGMLLGVDEMVTAFMFSLGVAALIGPLSDRADFAPETVVGIVFSAMLGVAFLCIGLMPGPKAKALNLFWGSILTVAEIDLWVMGAVCSALVAGLVLFFKEIRAVLCHRSVALAAGVPATAVYYAMLFATGATVTASLRSVGGLLIYSLIVNPAAAAYQLSYDLKRIFVLASLFGVASCWGGLAASHLFDIPSGAVIVLLSTIIFVTCTLFSPKKRGLSRSQRLSLNFSTGTADSVPVVSGRNHVR